MREQGESDEGESDEGESDEGQSEKAFRSNPWHYAKKVCSDKSQKPCLHCSPECAFAYFAESSREDRSYSSLPTWVSEVQHVPSDEDLLGFDLSPIIPGLVKKMLSKRPSSSAPGVDEITYRHLKMMPSTHHFLATLFSKFYSILKTPPPPQQKQVNYMNITHANNTPQPLLLHM